MVGVAGNYFTAKDLICEIFDRFSSSSCSFEEVQTFLTGEIKTCREPATLLGIYHDNGEVTVFRYDTSERNVKSGREFFEGTGGPTLRQMLTDPAFREIGEHKTGNRPPPPVPPSVLHEVIELAFLQQNNGRYLLDEFGGGFQVIELHEGKFRFVSNLAVIGSHFNIVSSGFDFHFEPTILIQRYFKGHFLVVACPMQLNQDKWPAVLDLDVAQTKYNVAENWIKELNEITSGDVWDELEIDYYGLVVVAATSDERQNVNSYLLLKVDSDNFTFRLVSENSLHRIILGSNFSLTVDLAYKSNLFVRQREQIPDAAHRLT